MPGSSWHFSALLAAAGALLGCGGGSAARDATPNVGGAGPGSGGGDTTAIAGHSSTGGAGAMGTAGTMTGGVGAGVAAEGGAASTAPTVPLPPLTHLPESLGPRFPDGIEPGDPAVCEATPPARCYWVDAAAALGGDGSFESPYSSFESVVGAMDGTDYVQGSIAAGDYLYVRGTFSPPVSDDPEHLLRVLFRRATQGGTPDNPTVIKSWRGSPRAIFDGQHQTNDMLVFAGMPSFRVANLEIQNAAGRGLLVESGQELAIFEDLVVHDTIGDGVLGVGGGLHFFGDANQQFVVRNCYFYANNATAFGAINNIGALSLTSDLEAPEHGSLEVYRNVFEHETTGVRHKHAGSYDTEIYENLFWNSERAIVLRSFRSNDIHDNTFFNLSESAVVSYVENTRGQLKAEIHHNNFFGTTRLLTDVIGVHEHAHVFDVHHNFYQGTSEASAYAISQAESLPFVSGASNIYLLPSELAFFTDPNEAGELSFAAFTETIADTSSVLHVAAASDNDASVFNEAYEAYAAEREAGSIGY